MRARPIAASLIVATIALPAGVSARPRPRFEPTDLEWEETGVAELDLEFGAIRSTGPWRFVIPDFEIDLGVFHNDEFNLDDAWRFEDARAAAMRLAVEDTGILAQARAQIGWHRRSTGARQRAGSREALAWWACSGRLR